jgi:hypothetical protein
MASVGDPIHADDAAKDQNGRAGVIKVDADAFRAAADFNSRFITVDAGHCR